MQNRTIGIVATVLTTMLCGCFGIMSCIWGGLIVSGTPIDVTTNGVTTPQVLPSSYGVGLLCLSVLLILIPAAVGFFALRKKTEVVVTDTPPAQ
jgi:hypothetical protein